MIFNIEKFKKIVPGCKHPDFVYDALKTILPKYNINTVNRLAGFLAQCGHESVDFNVFEENLNYTSLGLMRTFPRYFRTVDVANKYAHHPDMIANHVYANRMGNGDEASGDGWKYHGQGVIQITGKQNYTEFAESIGKTLDDTISYAGSLEGGIEAACWFWKSREINRVCDENDIVEMTRLVNGGTLGLDDRKYRYIKAKQLLVI